MKFLLWLDNKLVNFFETLHKRTHRPQCVPIEPGLTFTCRRCGQEWVSWYDRFAHEWRWISK